MTQEMYEGFDALIKSNAALVAAVRDLTDHIQPKAGRDAAVQAIKDTITKHEAPIARFEAHMKRFI